MTALTAIFVDQYRELSSRKIFWITLMLSLVLVIGYASIGFTESGMSVLFGLYSIESQYFKIDSPMATMLYKAIFSTFIVGMWLTWAATILALISTASIFPDLVARGSIDMVLSKPVSRVTIFFAKYAAGLLFALLQVGIVCVGVFFTMGWRVGDWNWMIFAAIPIVVVFFSYLYAISAFVGVVAKSAMTALLVALLFWFSLFSLQSAESILLTFRLGAEYELDAAREELLQNDKLQTFVAEPMEDLENTVERLQNWHRRLELVMYPLPKTGQTIGLLDRLLITDADITLAELFSGNFRRNADGEFVPIREEESEQQRLVQEHYDSKSLWEVLGTSLTFELLILLIACGVFVRRDF